MPRILSSAEFIRNHCINHVEFSECEKYRYVLSRQWDYGKGNALFIMLNPSTADQYANDPTVDKCMNWAIKWGYRSISVCNVFAYRETDRMKMVKLGENGFDVIGPENNKTILRQAKQADKIILGWGNEGNLFSRGDEVFGMLMDFGVYAMKINQNNSPGHPLYLKNSSEPIPYLSANREVH